MRQMELLIILVFLILVVMPDLSIKEDGIRCKMYDNYR
jgi:hypothetical protein